MILGLVFVLITAAVLGLLLFPLLRKQGAAPQRADYDIAVYRDQLTEVSKDVERNLLSCDQATAARAEIHRRMLAAADTKTTELKSNGSLRSKLALTIIIIIGLPLGAGLMYTWLGHPELPGKPYAQRQHDPDFILTADAEQLAAQLEANPDAEDYKRLAEIWFVLRRYDKAAEAYHKIVDMNGGDTNIWSSLGEATAFSNEGFVTPEARTAFVKALRLNSHNSRARFYMGISEAQINQPRRAVAIWRDLEKDSPPDAPWLPLLKKKIMSVSKEGGFDPESISPAPPSLATPDDFDPDAAAAVMAMNPSNRNATIHKMVDRLADKMKNNPDDLDGWLRLAKAYRALGETDKAEAAESKAAAPKSGMPRDTTPDQ